MLLVLSVLPSIIVEKGVYVHEIMKKLFPPHPKQGVPSIVMRLICIKMGDFLFLSSEQKTQNIPQIPPRQAGNSGSLNEYVMAGGLVLLYLAAVIYSSFPALISAFLLD